jgi:integrase
VKSPVLYGILRDWPVQTEALFCLHTTEVAHSMPVASSMRNPLRVGFLRDQLAEHLASDVDGRQDALVFTSPEGEPLRRGNFNRRLWRPTLQDVGLDLRLHDLRHTCAALLIAEGAHPKAVQSHLGHSSIQVTMDRYGHLLPSDVEELADRLDVSRKRTLETSRKRVPSRDTPGIGLA